MGDSGELQCIGKLEIRKPKPVVFLCGSLPVLTDSTFPLSQSALVPSPHTIGAPQYQMLPTETDLNTLPILSKNSEVLHTESGPLSQNLSRKCEALAVSGLTDYGDEIDVVAPTDILKQIFKIPYSKAQLSIAVHRVGDTLILNAGPDVEEGEKIFRRQSNQSKASDPSILINFAMHSVRAEACDCPPTHHPSSEKTSSSTILPRSFENGENSFASSSNSHANNSQCLDKNVSGSRRSAQVNDRYFQGTKKNKQKNKKPESIKRTSEVREKSRCSVQDSDKFRRADNDGFLRVLFWQFHNFRMLLGSDMLIFSNEKYVAVSLHLWDVARQVTPLTWLEAWLDNVMASVPELAICYHDNGVVQGYELLKTDNIYLLKGVSEDGIPAFHPQVVQQNGLSVLRFLQDNCKQDPGAYWLYKSAGEDMIQLFDLSVIPKDHSVDDLDKCHSSLPSLMDKGRKESLFSLGTLLYRVAHRLSLSKASDNNAKCAKFFKKCLDFLHEQDHLVVRAYAHEQFARLILKCYEEIELTSESFLLESEVTVTDLDDESSEFSLGMFGSTGHDVDIRSTKDTSVLQNSEQNSSMSKLDTYSYEISSATEVGSHKDDTSTSKTRESLDMCQISSTSPHVVRAVTDPISSKLAAIHHVSQAIKSLRWKRQLQNTQGGLINHGNKVHDRYSNFTVCGCGDPNCIEICDIREWLPKSKMDQKMWNLVLLLGESYLALGEAYKDDGQLHQALKVVKLACLVYGSMPQHLEDTRFISSIVNDSSCQLKVENGKEMDLALNAAKGSGSKSFQSYSSDQFFSPYFFWAKAWSLVGDVHVEFPQMRGQRNPVQTERKTSGNELRMSNEVVREVTRLKRKLGQYKQNCSSCSLINCSCQSERASSGSSASSSTRSSPPSYNRKQNRKLNTRNSSHSYVRQIFDNNSPHNMGSGDEPSIELQQNNNDREKYCTLVEQYELQENSATTDVVGHKDIKKDCTAGLMEGPGFKSVNNVASELRCGGIFKFLECPKSADVEEHLSAAIACYNAGRTAIGISSTGSAELHSILKKLGWVNNELGRYRLEKKDLTGAEIAFSDAIKAFKEVSDHTNIILINCNLGHGRRALAEELVTKMDDLKRHDVLQTAYKQAMKTAKLQYSEALKYYEAAKMDLALASDAPDYLSLQNDVYTQLAHTHLRLGMFLARETTSAEGKDRKQFDELYSKGRNKERRKHELSASDAFSKALSTYEKLGTLREQEAAFAHYQLACYYRDTCSKFLDFDRQKTNLSNNETSRQKAKRYASLADEHWQKAIKFYGPQTHRAMHLNILMERSALSWSLSNSHLNDTMEGALLHLLQGRHVVGTNKNCKLDQDIETEAKFWSQLQSLLKSMLLSLSSKAGGSSSQPASSNRSADSTKLREMYRMSLKSTSLDQLEEIHQIWVA